MVNDIIRLRRVEEEINRLRSAIKINADITGGVTDHMYLSNRGTYTHAQLDAAYPVTYSAQSTAGVALQEAYSAFSVASATWNYAVSIASTASTHYAAAASFHDFSIGAHSYGVLYDNGTNYVELPQGTTSYVLTQGANSPYWKAPVGTPSSYMVGEHINPNVPLDFFAGWARGDQNYVLLNDADAYMTCTFYVKVGGEFKVQMDYHVSTNEVVDGLLYFGAASVGETITSGGMHYDLANGVACSLAAITASTLGQKLSAPYAIGDENVVYLKWAKSAVGTALKYLYLHSVGLVRQ